MKRSILPILLIALGAGACLLAAPFFGVTPSPLSAALDPFGAGMEAVVFWRIRVPRVLTAFLAGAGLGVCGMAFQALFRNPLATPYTLGVSSGASLGAALYLRLGLAGTLLGAGGASGAAFAGAAAATLLVYGVARARGGSSGATLLLAGVAVSFFLSSMILAVQYSANLHDSFRLLRWLMGGRGMVGYDAVLAVLPFAGTGAAVIALMTQELNLVATGEDLALSRGMDVVRFRRLLFFAVSLTVGGVVAVCGPIGFVGMMAPHICRLIVGPDHRRLFPATLFFGGAFLTVCDAVARCVLAPVEIPVGIVTAMLGGPFFLWLLLTRREETF